MLVLTRKTQEKIQIGDSVTITVVRIKGNTVRVGIEAPRDVRVVREELVVRDAAVPRSVEADGSEVATATNSEEDAAEGAADGGGRILSDRRGAAEKLSMTTGRSELMNAHAV